jgi:hypothetical protein
MPQHSHWHYILGYLIVTVAHNWPALVALLMGGYAAWRLYRVPTRRHVQWLYGWALLLFAYEYAKHLGEELARPIVFLLTADWSWLQPLGIFLVTWLPPRALILVALALLLRALGRPPRLALPPERLSHR